MDRELLYNLTCYVKKIKPHGRIYWDIDGEIKGNDTTTTVIHNNDEHGTYALSNTYTHQFSDETEVSQVNVSIVMDIGNTTVTTHHNYMNVSVYCKFCNHTGFVNQII